tara:strand:+ start:39 stop:1280 length:1242 start_codon:yes stop_codon:yes gene_type:complete
MTGIKNNKNEINFLDIYSLFLFTLYPLAIISGNLLINIFILLLAFNFIFNLKNNIVFLKQKIFYILLFFFISLVVNLIFSTNLESTAPRVIKFFFVIFFIFEIQRIIQKFDTSYLKNIYKFFFIIFIILNLDIIFEIIFGQNILGYSAEMPGRIASFFGDELVVGAFYHGFILIFLSYLLNSNYNKKLIILCIFLIILISFLIGERANFIKSFISVIIFIFIVFKINYKTKISIFFIMLIAFISIVNLNQEYKYRYYKQIKPLFSVDGYFDFMKKSQYGAHRIAAYKIFEENMYFGVGIKNFRHEVKKDKYEDNRYQFTTQRLATHPHQVHHEFLSETGMIGYISFLIFILFSLILAIKNYTKTKNLYQLSGIIFVVTSLMPLLPSGSFFSTLTSGIFWFNFSLMVGYNKIKF